MTGALSHRGVEFDFQRLFTYDAVDHCPLRSEGAGGWDGDQLPCLEDILGYSGQLPAFPSLATRALQLLADPEVEVTELAKLINSDQAVSTQVLRVVNSAAFRGTSEIVNIQHAVTRLGLSMVAQILAVAATRSLFDRSARSTYRAYAPLWDRLWLNAITAAFSGLWLASNHARENAGEAFACCLLHDVGKTGVLHGVGELLADGRLDEPLPVWTVEFLMEDLHIAIGGEMALTWGLPGPIVRAIRDHHAPTLEPGAGVVHLVRLVSAFTEIRVNPHPRWGLELEALEGAATLGLTSAVLDRLATVIEQAEERARLMIAPAGPR